MLATTAPHDPVPEEAVSPTPRSQYLTSISRREITRTNSTFVRFGKSGWFSISLPIAGQSIRLKFLTKTEQCGLPIEVTVTRNIPSLVAKGKPTTGAFTFAA